MADQDVFWAQHSRGKGTNESFAEHTRVGINNQHGRGQRETRLLETPG